MGGAHLIVNGDPPQWKVYEDESPAWATTSAKWPATWAASSWVGASTMTRTSGSVPLGRIEHPAAAGKAPFGLVDLDRDLRGEAIATAHRHVDEHLGSRVMTDGEVGERPPGAVHEVEHPDAGEQAVAGRSRGHGR